jgi:hypothetical protein
MRSRQDAELVFQLAAACCAVSWTAAALCNEPTCPPRELEMPVRWPALSCLEPAPLGTTAPDGNCRSGLSMEEYITEYVPTASASLQGCCALLRVRTAPARLSQVRRQVAGSHHGCAGKVRRCGVAIDAFSVSWPVKVAGEHEMVRRLVQPALWGPQSLDEAGQGNRHSRGLGLAVRARTTQGTIFDGKTRGIKLKKFVQHRQRCVAELSLEPPSACTRGDVAPTLGCGANARLRRSSNRKSYRKATRTAEGL